VADSDAEGRRPAVVKFALVGWVLVKRRLREPPRPGSDVTHIVQALPLRAVWDRGLDDFSCLLGPRDEVVGVVPAPPGSYCVKCFPYGCASGVGDLLGYELPGADAPDWQSLCNKLREELDEACGEDEASAEPAAPAQ
jgi:hypothetical protein